MHNSFDVSFIICSNGYGHLKRVHDVCTEMLKLQPKLKVAFHISEKNLTFLQKKLSLPTSVLYITRTLRNEINWSEADKNTVEKRLAWTMDLATDEVLQNSKLIISDNHVLPVAAYRKALLMGSFLWHYVYKDASNEAYQIDVETLKLRKPPLLCIGDMVMTEALQETSIVALPWFCKKLNLQNRILNKDILITCGGTTFIRKQMIDVIEQIIPYTKSQGITVYLDEGLFTNIPINMQTDVCLFDFKSESFSKLMAIICRPGIGILTECVMYNVPAFVIDIENNKEIKHNAARFEELGYGERNIGHQTIDILTQVERFLSEQPQLESYRINLGTAKDGGAEMAARYILNNLKNE